MCRYLYKLWDVYIPTKNKPLGVILSRDVNMFSKKQNNTNNNTNKTTKDKTHKTNNKTSNKSDIGVYHDIEVPTVYSCMYLYMFVYLGIYFYIFVLTWGCSHPY